MGAAAQMRCGPPQTLPADCRSQVCGFPQSARLAARLASLIMRNFLARRLRVAAGVLLGSLSAVAELAMTLASGLWLLVTLGRSADDRRGETQILAVARWWAEVQRRRMARWYDTGTADLAAPLTGMPALSYVATRWTVGLLGGVVLLAAAVGTAAVLLPPESAEWPEERRRFVLVHEMAHVKRFDALTRRAFGGAAGSLAASLLASAGPDHPAPELLELLRGESRAEPAEPALAVADSTAEGPDLATIAIIQERLIRQHTEADRF